MATGTTSRFDRFASRWEILIPHRCSRIPAGIRCFGKHPGTDRDGHEHKGDCHPSFHHLLLVVNRKGFKQGVIIEEQSLPARTGRDICFSYASVFWNSLSVFRVLLSARSCKISLDLIARIFLASALAILSIRLAWAFASRIAFLKSSAI